MIDTHTEDQTNAPAVMVPTFFKYLLVASALFIAGVSAYFSVQGLGYLFAGSAGAVMIMAASLEVGKLVAASFLSRYWNVTNRVLKIYLVLAVLALIAITSLGNYGYLARAYERTHTQINLFETQIASMEREIVDIQRQIDGAKGSVAKSGEVNREDIGKLQQRITAGNDGLNQSLVRLQERRATAQERRDRDLQVPAVRVMEQGEALKKAIATEESTITTLNERLAALERAEAPKFPVEESAIATLNTRLLGLDRAEGPKFVAEESAIATLNERVAVLDRAVDAYTKQGAGGLFKADNIKKGQILQAQQRPAREAIASELADQRSRIEQLRREHLQQQTKARTDLTAELVTLRDRIEQLRREHLQQQTKARADIAARLAERRASIEQLRVGFAKQAEGADREIAAVRERFTQDMARLDTEEQDVRKAGAAEIGEMEKQLKAMQTQGLATVTTGDSQSESLYQRIRTRNEDIQRLRGQIAAVDIGSYRFVARAFDATADGVVKWLMLALVMVFDPLAVSLVIGFNVSLLTERPAQRSRSAARTAAGESGGVDPSATAPRSKVMASSLSLLLLATTLGAVVFVSIWGTTAFRDKARAGHGSLIPGGSFAVMTFRPDDLSLSAQGQTFADWLGASGGKAVSDTVAELMTNGFDPKADLYAFAKFPSQSPAGAGDRPVMLCGFVARVTDPVAVEAALSRIADQVSSSLRTSSNAAPSRVRSRAMIRHETGRYMDPEGGYFTFGLTEQAVILLIEFEGDPQAPCVEGEIRRCLTPAAPVANTSSETRDLLPSRARSRDGAISLWFDAGRFCKHLPKNPAAQTRYQQLEKHVGFDLVLSVKPTLTGQLNLIADYAYQAERFKDRQQATPLQMLTKLGTVETAGIGGRLMDRCVDTLDYDSLIERLRTALGGTNGTSAQQVLIEKTFTSERDARFVLSARYGEQAGPPLLAAMQTLFQ